MPPRTIRGLLLHRGGDEIDGEWREETLRDAGGYKVDDLDRRES